MSSFNRPCFYCVNTNLSTSTLSTSTNIDQKFSSPQAVSTTQYCPLALSYDIPTLCINIPNDEKIIIFQNEFWYQFLIHIWTMQNNSKNLVPNQQPQQQSNNTILIPVPSSSNPSDTSSKLPTYYSITPNQLQLICSYNNFRPLNLSRVLYRLYEQYNLLVLRSSLLSLSDCINYHLHKGDKKLIQSTKKGKNINNRDNRSEDNSYLTSIVTSTSSLLMNALTSSFSALSLLVPSTTIDTTSTTDKLSDNDDNNIPSNPDEEYLCTMYIDQIISTILTTAIEYSRSIHSFSTPSVSSSTYPKYLGFFITSIPSIIHPTSSSPSDPLPLSTSTLPLSLPELFQKSSLLRTFLITHSDNTSTTNVLLHEHVYTIILPRLIMQGYGTLVMDNHVTNELSTNTTIDNQDDNTFHYEQCILILPNTILNLPSTTSAINNPLVSPNKLLGIPTTPTTIKSPLPTMNFISPTGMISPIPTSSSSYSVPSTTNIIKFNDTDINTTVTSLLIQRQLANLNNRLHHYDTLTTNYVQIAKHYKQKNLLIPCKYYIKKKLLLDQSKSTIYTQILNMEKILLSISEAHDNISQMNILTKANDTLKNLTSLMNIDDIQENIETLQGNIDDINNLSNILNQDMMDIGNDNNLMTNVEKELNQLDDIMNNNTNIRETNIRIPSQEEDTTFHNFPLPPNILTNLPSQPSTTSNRTLLNA